MEGGTLNTFVITLPERQDRRDRLQPALLNTSLNWHWFPGIDGSRLPRPDGWGESQGAWGCRESHRAVLQTAILTGLDTFVVLEDDVTLCPDFDSRLTELLGYLPSDWDAVFLGGQHVRYPLPTDHADILRCAACHRTHAYILRGEYIKRLYALWSSMTDFGHIDHVWGGQQHQANIYAPRVWLCGQAAGVSDVNGQEHQEKWWHG